MATKELTLNKLVDNSFSSGSTIEPNKGANGSTYSAVMVFNALNESIVLNSATPLIGSIKVGGGNLFTEKAKFEFALGTYNGSAFTAISGWTGNFTVSEGSVSNKSCTIDGGSYNFSKGTQLAYRLKVSSNVSSRVAKTTLSTFKMSIDYAALNYIVTVNISPPGGGTAIGGGTYGYGTTASVTATPSAGYVFKGWANQSGNITTTSNPYSFLVNNNTTFSAVFELQTFTVNWKNGDTILETDTNVSYGSTPEYNGAMPTKPPDNEHIYTFSGWNPVVGAITSDTTYTAQFDATKRMYSVAVTAFPKEGGNVSGGNDFGYNASVILTAVPADDYVFLSWNDGVTSSSRQITVLGDVAYTAYFKLNKIFVNLSQTPSIFVDTVESTEVFKDLEKVYG